MGEAVEAMESYQRALAIQERLTQEYLLVPNYQADLGWTLNHLAAIDIVRGRWQEAKQRLERASDHQRKALAAMPSHRAYRRFLGEHLRQLTQVYKELNQPAEAVQAAQESADLASGEPAGLYNAACTLALSVPLVPGDQRQALASEAVQTLKRAVAAGWGNALFTSRDPDFAVLRDRDDFRRVVAELFDRGFPADPFAK